MIIIVEGTDRVGKTTLVNMLRDRMAFVSFKDHLLKSRHVNNSKVMSEKLYSVALLLKEINSTGVNVVIDRFHLTELVYGMVERTTITSTFGVIDRMLAEMGAIIVHVQRTNHELSDKLAGYNQSRHEELFDHLIDDVTKCSTMKTCFETLEGTYLRLIHILHQQTEEE